MRSNLSREEGKKNLPTCEIDSGAYDGKRKVWGLRAGVRPLEMDAGVVKRVVEEEFTAVELANECQLCKVRKIYTNTNAPNCRPNESTRHQTH